MIVRSEFIFHHLGALTSDPDSAARLLTAMGYEVGGQIIDPLQKVALRMATFKSEQASAPAIELITPLEDNVGLSRLISRRGDFIYHLCYEVSNTAEAVEFMEQPGSRAVEVSPPQPAVLFGGHKVSFYMAPCLGLIELLEISDERDEIII